MDTTVPPDTGDDWAKRLRYLQIDEACRERLRRLRPILLQALPGILDKFYQHALCQPELREKFASQERIAFAKEAQARHWGLLFDGHFDDHYKLSADRIGSAHYRIGLTPRWYMAGYSFVLDLLQAVVVKRNNFIVKTPTNDQSLIENLHAVSRAIMLDMELAISRYWELLANERRSAVDKMIDRIEQQVTDTVNSVTHVTGDLVHSAEMMTCVSMTVDVNSQNAAEAAQSALGSAQTVAAAAEELHASIDEIATQVQRSAITARDAVDRMQDARGVVGALGDAAQDIGKVVQIIGGIAAQTNLLALNATIEAARAGEAGRGFAVVAGEVKNLANQSATSAKEITKRITTIQEVSRSTGLLIDEVSQTIQKMEQISTAIAAAIDEQSAATSEIARAVSETATQNNAVTSLMAGVSENVSKANRASLAVGESASRMEETLASMRKLLTKAVRTSSAIANRRQRRRRAVLLDIEIVIENKKYSAILYDLSECGALVATDISIRQDTDITLTLTSEKVSCIGSVVACGNGQLHIHFFETLSASQVDAIAAKSIQRICELAKSDHLSFVERISQAVNGDTLSATNLATHHTCRLGRWYDSVCDEVILALPAFFALAEPHREVHTKARQVLIALESEQIALAQTRLEELKASSAQVILGLNQLCVEFFQTNKEVKPIIVD